MTAADLVAKLPPRRRAAIPLADAAALAYPLRRTTLLRLVLAAMLVVACAAAVWRAVELNPRTVAFLPQNSTTVVVIDQSRSIFVGAYRRIAATLERLAAADVPIALVAFSDTAYEMLPPGSRSSELKPLLRFYTPARHGSNVDPSTNFLASPWDNVFSAGTKISFGLDLAQSILRRDKIRHGTILLLSDLETAGEDQPALARSLLRIKRDPRVRLKLVPLFPLRADKRFFSGFVRRDDFVKPSQLQPTGGFGARHSVLGRTPWPLLVVIGLLLVALAANEVLCARLHVPVRERRAT